MKTKQQLLEDSFELCVSNTPLKESMPDIAHKKVTELAEYCKADKDIAMIGFNLIDIRIQQSKKEGDITKHPFVARDFAKTFLKDYDLTQEEANKIINCIEAHHGQVPYTCIEAEIVANADCYRFIHPHGALTYIGLLEKRKCDINANIEQLKFKQKEKYSLISLNKVKEELSPYYNLFNELLK